MPEMTLFDQLVIVGIIVVSIWSVMRSRRRAAEGKAPDNPIGYWLNDKVAYVCVGSLLIAGIGKKFGMEGLQDWAMAAFILAGIVALTTSPEPENRDLDPNDPNSNAISVQRTSLFALMTIAFCGLLIAFALWANSDVTYTLYIHEPS